MMTNFFVNVTKNFVTALVLPAEAGSHVIILREPRIIS